MIASLAIERLCAALNLTLFPMGCQGTNACPCVTCVWDRRQRENEKAVKRAASTSAKQPWEPRCAALSQSA